MKEFIQILRRFVPPYKKYLALSTLFNILSAVLNIFSFSLIVPILSILFQMEKATYTFMPWSSDASIKDIVINNFQYYITELINQYGPSTTLLLLGLFMACMTFLKTGCYFLSSATMIPIRTGIVRDIRVQLYKKLLSLPLGFFSEERKGDIIARMSGDVNEIENSIMSSLDMLLKNPILIISYFTTLIIISWQLTLFTIAIVPIMGWVMGTVGKKLKRGSLIAQGQWSDLMSQLEETLGGLRIIKAFNAEKKMNTRFTESNNLYRNTINHVNIRQQMAHPMSEFLGTILIVIVLWFGGTLILHNNSTITAPSFIFYLTILYSVINPLKDFSKAGYNIPKGLASMERVDKILMAENKMKISPNPVPVGPLKEKIEFRDVCFKYENQWVLQDINLTIEKGKTVALVGQSGSGKSTYLYQHVIEESEKNPQENFIVLVPEQFTMQTQKDLVRMHPRHGIMNIDVLSFARLAYRVFEETGVKKIPVLDDEGKNLILRKIAGNYEDKLTVLKGNIKKLGYISEVKSVISEFTQYDIGEEELDDMIDSLDEESRLYYKLKDIRLLYDGFQDYLKERYITKEELLDVLSREVRESELLKNSTVVLDGFTGFTPVQNRLILELMKYCKGVWITVIMDERENPYSYRHPYQLFGLSKQMVTTLISLAREEHIAVEEPVCLYGYPVKRFEKNKELAFLERNIFRYGAGTYEKEVKNLGIHVARNPGEEAMAVAEEIRKLVRKERYRYREIGVIVSDMNVYGDYLEQAFETYGIPVFMDHKRSILLNSFVEYLRSLLNMAEKNFSYESVFRFLRTNLAGFSYEEVDEPENYVIGLGIRGYKDWQNRWIRRMKGMEEEELERLNHYRVQMVEKVDNLMFVLKQKRKTVKDITLAIYEFMVQENIQERLKKTEEEFQEAGELALAKEYSQIYRIIIELFDKFVALLGELSLIHI